MATAPLVYPAGVPCPQASTVTPAERRALTPSRPRDARPLQRDRLSFERLTWPPLTIAQSDDVLTWWRDTLTFGGSWFAADWPSPRGRVTAVRKFREQPAWQFVAGGFWRLSALCEVRGVGELPRALVTEEVVAWDPGQTSELITLSDANSTATFASGSGSHRTIGARSRSTGKWYFEILANSTLGGTDIWAPALGLAELPFSYVSGSAPPSGACVALSAWGRLERIGDTPVAVSYGNGSVIGVAVDLDALKCWIAVDGTWIFSGDPATGTNESSSLNPGHSHAPLFWSQSPPSGATLRTRLVEFTETMPSGFLSWGSNI